MSYKPPHSVPGWPCTTNDRILQMRTLYPVQQGSVCNFCGFTSVPLPTWDDFKTLPHDNSSRINTVTNCTLKGWKFENFRKDVYFCSWGNPPAWSFSHGGALAPLCNHQAQTVESVYGLFLYSLFGPDRCWFHTGYRHVGPPNALTIWFSLELYLHETASVSYPNTTAHQICAFHRQPGNPQQQIRPRLPAPFPPIAQVFSELQKRFNERYKSMQLDFQKYPVLSIFDLTMKNQELSFNGNDSADGSLSSLFDFKTNRVLVQGAAGFGKSVLASVLGHQWACDVSPINHYKLCILCDLTHLSIETDVTQSLVNFCMEVLKNSTFTAGIVAGTLEDYSEKIVLLLDAYDMLSDCSQHKLKFFLENSAVFCKSSILVTTRYTADDNLLKRFHKHVYIRGFSKTYLKKYLLLEKREHENVNLFNKNVSDIQMYALSTLSPYFTWFAYSAIRDNLYNCRNCQSSYPLFEYTIQKIISQNLTSSSTLGLDVHKSLHKLGEIFFRSLVKRKTFFTLDMLRQAFGNDIAQFIEWNIFCRKDRDEKLWFVPSKMLKVFFATMYLRNSWSELRNDEQRREFLRNVFCCGMCEGDYVHGEDCLYYVGLIPEIVLKLSSDRSFQTATFEMYYDVERVEHSTAFDSVNLLSRVSVKYLDIFGFKVLPDEDELALRTFGSVLDFSPVHNCKVEYSFHANNYEQKHFLMVDARNQGGVTFLQAILRAKTDKLIDRIYIDFLYRELEGLFHFVRALLSLFLKDFELPDEVKGMEPKDFIFNLVWLICVSIETCTATVVCSSSENDCFNTFASFKVCWNDVNKETDVYVFDQNFKFTKYNKDNFSEAESMLEVLFENCENATSNLDISINLF